MKRKKGIAVIMIVLMIVAIIGSLGLIIDKGRIYYYRWKLINATQAAVMAGLQDLPDKTEALRNCYKALKGNNFNSSLSDKNINFVIDSNKIVATATQEIPMTMAQILGYRTWTISTQVTGRIGPIAVQKRVAPIGVEISANTIQFYKRYRLENDIHYSPGTEEINIQYYPLDLPGGLQNNILNGYAGELKINHTPKFLDPTDQSVFNQLKNAFEQIDNTPNVWGTFGEDLLYKIDTTPRLIRVAIVEDAPNTVFQYDQKKLIKGFALFYIEQVHVHTDDNKKTVSLIGFFAKHVTEGPIMDTKVNYGVVGTEFVDIK